MAKSPGRPRIPDVKTVTALMPTPREIPALANVELTKYMVTVPRILRINTFKSHSILLRIAPMRSTSPQTAIIGKNPFPYCMLPLNPPHKRHKSIPQNTNISEMMSLLYSMILLHKNSVFGIF